MFIYNVTIKVEWSIHDEWLAWMKETEIPRMLGTGYFVQSHLLRLMDIDETDGATYAVQFHAETREDYDRYVSLQSPVDSANTYALWGQRSVFFSTLMLLVQ